MQFGGIEAGGTKMVCAVADETGKLLDRTAGGDVKGDRRLFETV